MKRDSDKNVSVLGTIYKIYFEEADSEKLEGSAGLTDPYDKVIYIEIQECEEVQKHVLRHEIVHAFLFESGIEHQWEHQPRGHEEFTVDWIALQHKKLHAAFKAVGAI